ncbi:MAG: 50S ribosomal protein L6 [bacterium]|nr:50S ribosomal protein L6 [bacterium]
MSRVGKQILTIPKGVTVTNDRGLVTVVGPRGTLSRTFRPDVQIIIEDGMVRFEKSRENQFTNALWGTYASHVLNMITGVTNGFTKILILDGVGFRVELAGDTLKMALGFSHPVIAKIPEGIKATVEKNKVTIEGNDKEHVGTFAAKLYSLKKPEPYKGKGFHYEGQHILRKQGKRQGTAA